MLSFLRPPTKPTKTATRKNGLTKVDLQFNCETTRSWLNFLKKTGESRGRTTHNQSTPEQFQKEYQQMLLIQKQMKTVFSNITITITLIGTVQGKENVAKTFSDLDSFHEYLKYNKLILSPTKETTPLKPPKPV